MHPAVGRHTTLAACRGGSCAPPVGRWWLGATTPNPPRHRRHTSIAMAAQQQQQQRQQEQSQQLNAQQLWARVLQVYDAAQASGAATRTETSATVTDNFVLRVVSALNAKPQGHVAAAGTATTTTTTTSQPEQQQQQQQQQQQRVEQSEPARRPANPFLPYEEALWVSHLSDTHTLLLNKFNVVPHHVLVVTRAFESQSEPLNAADLAATQQVLAAMPRGGVAFYNCGEFSGRSQPHKHLQVVPLPFIDADGSTAATGEDEAQPPIAAAVLAAQAAAGAGPLQPFELRQLPFRAYAVRLTPSTSADELAAAAGALLAHCQEGLPAPVSYNAVLTRSLLLMVPRRAEACGRVAINSLGFAGTILLKCDADRQFAAATGPLNMLAAVGQPWDTAPSSSSS